MHATGWSRDLSVEVAGHDVINHVGAVTLRLIADRTGLTGGLSRALARPGFVPVHDRGQVLADTAVLIADGGRVLSDLATLRDQGELYGPVAWIRRCGGPWMRSGNRSAARSPGCGPRPASMCGH